MHERLKLIRKNLNLTQEEFAKVLGIKRTSYASYETGRVIPSPPFIKLICNKYNVSENWLLYGKGEKYIKTKQSIIDELVNTYNLSHYGEQIIQTYLDLPDDKRAVIDQFVEQLANNVNVDTTLVAARGNSELKIVSDDDAMRKDIENYIPPKDL